MKRKLLILAGLFMMFQFGFSVIRPSGYYNVKDEKVTYVSLGRIEEVEKADFKTFKILDNNLGIDKEYLFIHGKIAEGIDVKTFEIVSWETTDYSDYSTSWGGVKFTHIEKFKDKNGTYELKDIQNIKLKLEE